MELETLLEVIKKALNTFFEKDSFLIKNDTHEQAISHKIAFYLENELKNFLEENNYSIDTEYNRYWEDPKRSKELDNNLIKPDIIIHKRWENNEDSNLIIFEIKKWELNENDIKKLKEMTKNSWEFKYQYWIWLYNLIENQYKIDIYQDWEK